MSKPAWKWFCYRCTNKGEVKRVKAPAECPECGARNRVGDEVFWTERVLTEAEKSAAKLQEYLKHAHFRCGAPGDFGHQNIWGSPFLMFNTYCTLPPGHAGKHSCRMDLKVAPSFEPAGAAVERKSVEVTGEAFVHWELKPEAEEAVRWKHFVEVWYHVGRLTRSGVMREAA
jgi:hypothetical protein